MYSVQPILISEHIQYDMVVVIRDIVCVAMTLVATLVMINDIMQINLVTFPYTRSRTYKLYYYTTQTACNHYVNVNDMHLNKTYCFL